ncbi:MAG: adenylate/guanylate cyclase domain-containing protein [Acidimicrobiia bacterium]
MSQAANRAPRLLVAVNADVVGFSRLMADDPVATAETMESYRQLVEEMVAASSGILVNFVGDNFMAVFDDAKDAMQASIAISSEIEHRNADLPNHRWARFRMGIDQGDVTESGGQYFGDALNIAARIQAEAPSGGISVSGRVYRALDEPALRFRPASRLTLKNIPEPVEVFEFADLPLDHLSSVQGRPRRLTLEQPTVAVLPIHTETAGDQARAAADVIRSDLVHRLARLPRLNLIDSGASDRGRQGPAQYLLETGVIQVGDNVRVYAKVMHMATMNVVTSHKWATTVDELFDLSEQISDEVTRSIEIELVIGEQARLYRTIDPEAVDKIYEGWYHLSADTPDGWLKAVSIFEEVAVTHPEEVYGQSLSAFANWMGATSGFTDDPEAVLDRAFEQASMVIERDDPTGLGHMVHAAIQMLRGNPEEALKAIESAHITRPTCDLTYALEGSVRRYLGQWEKAVDLLDTAIRLSAVTPAWYPTVQACSLFVGGRLDTAGATAEEVIEHQPNSLEALMILAAVQSEMGLERRARATAELIKDRFPAVDIEAWLEANPFTDRRIVERWRQDLTQAGLVTAGDPNVVGG